MNILFEGAIHMEFVAKLFKFFKDLLGKFLVTTVISNINDQQLITMLNQHTGGQNDGYCRYYH